MNSKILSAALLAFAMLASVGLAEETGVLVSDNTADLSAAEIYVAKINARLIVTSWGDFEKNVLQQIKNLTNVIIVGGSAAVPEEYEIELEKLKIDVKRLNGKDRYETAALIAASGWNTSELSYLAQGLDEKGILEIKIKAKATLAPILYTKPEGIPENVKLRIKELKVKKVQAVLAPDADEEEIESDLNETNVVEINKTAIKFKERAAEAIEDAEEEIAELEKELTNETRKAVTVLYNNALKHLENAKTAFNEGKYGRAFGQSTAAKVIAKNAQHLLEKIKEVQEEIEEAKEKIAEEKEEAGEEAKEGITKAQEKIKEVEKTKTAEEKLEKVREALKELRKEKKTEEAETPSIGGETGEAGEG